MLLVDTSRPRFARLGADQLLPISESIFHLSPISVRTVKAALFDGARSLAPGPRMALGSPNPSF